MSTPLTDLFTGGVTGIVSAVNDILGKFITDPEKKLEATVKLQQMATDLQVKIIDQERDLAVQQASIITAEAKSESWIARNWRPVTMLVFVYIIAHNYIFVTLFHLQSVPIPPDMWDLLKIGIGGYIAGRSVEKIGDSVSAAFASKKPDPPNLTIVK
jgi:hypothetical protein